MIFPLNENYDGSTKTLWKMKKMNNFSPKNRQFIRKMTLNIILFLEFHFRRILSRKNILSHRNYKFHDAKLLSQSYIIAGQSAEQTRVKEKGVSLLEQQAKKKKKKLFPRYLTPTNSQILIITVYKNRFFSF